MSPCLLALEPDGHMIIATFSPDGPESCAGLTVRRYGVTELSSEFAPEFEAVASGRLDARTEEGDQRPYVYAVFRRTTRDPHR